MKAAVTTQWETIEIKDVPTPQLGPGQILIRPRLAGVCGSDVHIYLGHHPTAQAPIIQGHEFVGTVETVGPDTPADLQVGDRVVVEPLISCGRCEACRQGHRHVCRDLGLLGIHRDGAFAELVTVDAAKVLRVPDALDDRLAALAEPFAVGVHVTARGGLRATDKALVMGAGPIGLIIAMTARMAGAEVAIADISPARVQQARSMGLTACRAEQLQRIHRDMTDSEGFDVIFEASGAAAAVAQTPELCRIRGTIVGVGFVSPPPTFDVRALIFKELHLVGSRVYSLEDFRRSLSMIRRIVETDAFDLSAMIAETCHLGELGSAIDRMHRGECDGKILIEL
jgi:2-desacetyl-2-hydroxyethyl bacteriochlorophyllide A dehydrogenase